jgi:LacI family transcriptional regulator
MTAGKTRLKDIAMLAGVSIGTVDRVLHERGEVAAKTKEKVKKILLDTNYSPDITAQVLKSRKTICIASLLPEPSDENAFWKNHPSGMKKAINELDLFRINLYSVTFDMQNEEDFQQKAGEILKLNPNGVMLAPLFKSESVEFCRELSKLNIPYVFVDGFIDSTDYLAFIGEDAYRSGRVAGQLADLVTRRDQKIAIVCIARNIMNVQHLNNRINGFLSYFNKTFSSAERISRISITDPTPVIVENALDMAFAEHPGISTVYMSGSKSFLIASYLEKKGLDNVHLIGYDLLDRNVAYLRSGRIRFLIGQRPEEQTYKAVRKLFDFLSFNRIPEEKEYLPIDIVTSENVDFFLNH